MKVSARAGGSSEGPTGDGFSSKPPFVVVGRIWFLGAVGLRVFVHCWLLDESHV